MGGDSHADGPLRQELAELRARVAELAAHAQQSDWALRQAEARCAALAQAACQNDERLRLSLEGSGVGLWDWNVASGELFIIPADVLGYPPQEFQQRFELWLQKIHPQDAASFHEALNEHFQGRVPLYETVYRALSASGQWIWILSRGKVVARDAAGQPLRAVGMHIDISQRKEAEEALRESEARQRHARHLAQRSEERFELVVQAADVGIWDWDLRTGKVYYSPRWKRLLGYEEHEISDTWQEWATRLHPDDFQRTMDTEKKIIDGEPLPRVAEFRLRHKDGSYRWIAGQSVVVRDAQGKPIRLVGSHGDITDRKQAEEAVLREQRLLKQLLEVYERHRQLVAFEIHDGLAQPLAAALMALESIPRSGGAPHALDDEHVGRVMRLLRDSLAETRQLMSGLRPSILDDFGVLAAVESLLDEVRQRSGLEIEYDCRVRFTRLAAPLETILYRIVQESLANAARHSCSPKVRLTLVQEGDQLRVTIEDWGVGFDPECVAPSRFGLAGMRERARLFGGEAAIHSAPGQGTRIVVHLPVLEPDDDRPSK